MDRLERGRDEIEQYQQRLCLRMNGIELGRGGANKSGDERLEKVKTNFEELNV